MNDYRIRKEITFGLEATYKIERYDVEQDKWKHTTILFDVEYTNLRKAKEAINKVREIRRISELEKIDIIEIIEY